MVGYLYCPANMKLLSICLLVVAVMLSLGCSDESISRSDKPLTRAAASKELSDMPLPASAHSIYYLSYVGGTQDLETYVRFDVDPQELDPAVDSLVTWNNRQMKRSLAYPRAPLSAAIAVTPDKNFLPMPWWDPATVKKGYFRGHIDGYALRILVDQARSRVYVYQND